MAKTGESYQRALDRIRAEHSPNAPYEVDLVRVTYFGVAATLATYELADHLACVVVTSPHHRGPYPASILVALAGRGPPAVH